MIPHDMIGDVGEHLSATALAVAAALAMYADNDTGECYPTLKTVAAKVKMHRNTVRKAVADLEAAGWLERTHRRRLDNRGNRESGTPGPPSTSNLYRLLWIAPREGTAKSPPSEVGVYSSRAGGVYSSRATELEPIELEPPPPSLDSHQEPAEAAEVVVESVPDTPVADLDAERAARFCSQVLDALVRSEYEAAQEAALTNGKPISNPGGYRRGIKQRLVEEGIEAEIVAYQEQYPDDTPDELADRLAPDRSPGARPAPRPTVEDQSEEGYARRIRTHSNNPEALLNLGGGAQ
jgi:hypothetical protein